MAHTLNGSVEDQETGELLWSNDWAEEEAEDRGDEDFIYMADDESYNQKELEIEEDVICWFVDEGIDPAACSKEDLEMIPESVEAESFAFYTRSSAKNNGFSTPGGGSNYRGGGNGMTPQEKQAKVMAAKQRSTCRACGQQGHWERDAICPKRKGKNKGKGKFKGFKGGSKNKGKKGNDKGSSEPKPRVVYFSVNDEGADEDLELGGQGNVAFMGVNVKTQSPRKTKGTWSKRLHD